MCYFLAVGVSAKGVQDLEALRRQRYGLGVDRCINPSIAALFPRADSLFFLTDGHCSCDLVIEVKKENAGDIHRSRLKYRKKGWSDAKIERALANSQASSATPSTPREQVLKLLDALQTQVNLCGSVRIYAHWYRGAVQEEVVPPALNSRISMDAFRAAHGVVPTDVVVEIVRDGA